MARSSVALDREAESWVMRVSEGAGGGGSPVQTLRLRLKPPIDEQAVTPTEQADMPGLTPEPGCPGVDAQGRLVPWFGGANHAEAAAAQAAGARDATGATPVAAAAVQAAANAAAAAVAGGEQPPSPGAALQAARAAALGAPPRKRLRKAGEVGSPRGNSGPAPSPRAQHPSAGGAAPPFGSTEAALPQGSPSASAGEPAEPSSGSGGGGDILGRDRSETAEGEEEEEEDFQEAQQQDKFDTQCSLCDNGGILLACDGPCMRSFHAGLEDDDGGGCNMLLLPRDLAQYLANSNETLKCPNCLAHKHQCFICKQLGTENKEVFKCIHASCGRHYHPGCVGEEEGQPFIWCATCGGYAEGGPTKEGEIVPCRRCPIAYHRRCLPADLPRCRDRQETPLPRVWLADYDEEDECWLDGVEQSLCYCRRHRMNPETQQAEFEIGPVSKLYDRAEQQPYTLVNKKLLTAFRLYYAKQYRHLESSRRLLARCAEKQAEREKKKEEVRAERAKRATAEADESEEDMPLGEKRRRMAAGGPEAAAPPKATARAKAAAPAAASSSEEDVLLGQKKRRLHRAAPPGKPQAAAAPSKAAPAAGKAAAAPAPAAALASAAAQALRQQTAAQAAPAAAAEDEEREETVSAGSTASQGTQDAAEASQGTEDAADASQGTEDAAEAGGLIEAGEEVLQPLLPAGARPGARALPPAAAAQAQAAAPKAGLFREDSQQQRLREALDRLLPLPSSRERRQRVKRLLAQAEDDPALTKDALWHATRRPEPYRHAMKKTIDEGKLANFENAVRHARTGRVPAHQLLDRAAVQSIVSHYDDLFMVLAPYLHGERYSSYGRHFTSPALLHRVADRLALFLRSGDQVVDFSCGENLFVPYLKRRCLSMGMAVSGRSYDIILAKDATDFVLKSWFDTRPGQEGLAPRERLCICLNPPFGKNNSLADKFVLHAAVQFQPRLIALIVPPRTVIPPGYQVVLENSKMCGGEEFYVPGSTHRSWNKEWPVLRILMRQECNPAMAHMGEPTEFEELLDCNAVLQPQHAQQAAQQYQQYTARYAAGAAGAQQQPFAASAPKPWGYFGSYGWPG